MINAGRSGDLDVIADSEADEAPRQARIRLYERVGWILCCQFQRPSGWTGASLIHANAGRVIGSQTCRSLKDQMLLGAEVRDRATVIIIAACTPYGPSWKKNLRYDFYRLMESKEQGIV